MFPISENNKAGSITLKSSFPMDYSRGVLSNKWHLKREAEPRDHELWSDNTPNLQRSTYKCLSKTLPDERMLFETETKTAQETTLKMLAESKNIDPFESMVDLKNKNRIDSLLENYGNMNKALPHHRPGHEKHHLETTYVSDYKHPSPGTVTQTKSEAQLAKEFEKNIDNSWGYRKMVSQFSDIDAPKRSGINTFHVQHGEYPNQLMKNELRAKHDNKIFELKQYTA